MRLRGRSGIEPARWSMRKPGKDEPGRSKVVRWDGAMKAVAALSMRAAALAVGGFAAARADLVIRGIELNFLGAATSVWSKRDSAEGSEKFIRTMPSLLA
jgi:hypothetical protein